MKTKTISASLFTVFVLLISVFIISAADFSVSTNNLYLTKSRNITSFTITNNNLTDNIFVSIPEFLDISDEDGHTIYISQTDQGIIEIANDSSKTIDVSFHLDSGVNLDKLALGEFSSPSIVIINQNNTNETESILLKFRSDFCDYGELEETISEGTRYLEISTIRDLSSGDDWEWKPLDEIELEVKIKFHSDDEDDEIDGIIQIGLYDTEKKEFIEFDDDDSLEREISLDEGEKITESFFLEIPVEDVEDSSSRYRLYVKAYEDGDEDNLCVSNKDGEYYQDVEIQKSSHEVILSKLEFITTEPIPCEEVVEIKIRVSNIGRTDEDKVKVSLYNSELGLDLESEDFRLYEGDSKEITFAFKIPKNIEEKTYKLYLYAHYRYSDSSEIYRDESDSYILPLEVKGNCNTDATNLQIIAELDPSTPEAIAGNQLVIRATLKNTGTLATTYSLSIDGNSAWSSLISIEPQLLYLEAGQSRDVTIFLDLDENAEGEKEFTIKVIYDNKETEQKLKVFVNKEANTASDIANYLKNNIVLFSIIIVNIILIIIIIVVIKKSSHIRAAI